jgi:hypothetical protein
MNATTHQRYQIGGDIYNRALADYGLDGAGKLARAADDDFANPDSRRVNEVLVELRHGNPLPEGTGGILVDQIISDPFDAPLDAAESAVQVVTQSAMKGLLTHPMILGLAGFAVWWKFFRK